MKGLLTILRLLTLVAMSALFTAFVYTPLYFVVIIIAIYVFRMPIAVQTGVGFDDGGYSEFMLGIGLPLIVFAATMTFGFVFLLLVAAGGRAMAPHKKPTAKSDLE